MTPPAAPSPLPFSTAQPSDRRRYRRVAVAKPAKIFLRDALRYAPAETTDVSAGGALIRVDRARAMRPGDAVDIAVGGPGAPAVIASDAMIEARIVRVLPIDHFHQAVAVEFKQPVELANVA